MKINISQTKTNPGSQTSARRGESICANHFQNIRTAERAQEIWGSAGVTRNITPQAIDRAWALSLMGKIDWTLYQDSVVLRRD